MQLNIVIKLLIIQFFSITLTIAQTNDYPNKPIRIIVPFAPGGSVDISARTIAPLLSIELGQSVYVENRVGAGGKTGAAFVAKSLPDGYILLAGSSGSLTAMEAVSKNLSYDVIADFYPIALMNVTPMAIIAGPNAKYTNFADFVKFAKENPGQIGVGSAGIASSNHLAIELLQAVVGIKLLHVPYKGSGQALVDLLSGQIPVMVDQVTSSINYVKDRRLTPIAMMTPNRSSAMPLVPTLKELGYEGIDAASFTGILAPAGISILVADKLQQAILKVASNPIVVKRFQDLGAEPRALNSLEFQRYLKIDSDRWKAVASKANILLD
jgi:tripartite-type tricarboxylate transporter receptor subunit TctC